MLRNRGLLLGSLVLLISSQLPFLTTAYSRWAFVRSPRLSALSVPLRASIESRQLATEWNGLVFRSGFQGPVYLLNLSTEQLSRIADGIGQWLSVSPDGRMIAFDSEGDLYLANADGAGLRRIADGVQDIDLLSWSPDGRWLAYELVTSSPDRSSAVYVMSLDTLVARRVSAEDLLVRRYLVPVSWFPDSRRVLFRACKDLPGTERNSLGTLAGVAHYDLYLADVNGDTLVNLTRGVGNVMDFYLSPDGQTIVFTSHLENRELTEQEGVRMYDSKVYLMNLLTGKMTEAVNAPMGDQGPPLQWYTPPWSPDSAWVLLPTRQPGRWRAVRPDGTLHHEIIAVSGFTRGDVGIDWLLSGLSPDGMTIAGRGRFDEGDSEGLCAVDANGENFRMLVPGVNVDAFVWSPDGKSIFFSYTVGEYSLDDRYAIVNADGTGLYEPFASSSGKPIYAEGVHWVRLPAQVFIPTAISSPAFTPSSTSTPVPTVTFSPTSTRSPTDTPTPTGTSTSASPSAATPLASRESPTATPLSGSAIVPTSTPTSGSGICPVSGVVAILACLGWWALRREG